jgi:YVTN family beta-propeller protein
LPFPFHIAVNPNGGLRFGGFYVVGTNGTLGSFESNIDSLLRLQKVSTAGFDLAVNPSANMIYPAEPASNSVSAIDTLTYAVVDNISLGSDFKPGGIAVNPITNMVYVTNQNSDKISVMDAYKMNIGDTVPLVANITVGARPFGVAVNPDTNMIYVTNQGSF